MKKILHYLNTDIWKIPLSQISKFKAFKIRTLRILMLTAHGFMKNQIQLGSASLTYYSLLAIVPVIAILIGIARGFLMEKTFETWLINQFAEQDDIIKRVFSFANVSLEQASQGVIAAFGILLLLWAAIKIMTSIEIIMNQLWEVEEGRSIGRRFIDYLALILVIPVVIFLSSGLNVYVSAAVNALGQKNAFFRDLNEILVPVLQLLPIVVICLLWSFLYLFIPNTKVRFLPAFCGGIFTAVFYQLFQWIYFSLQVGVAKYNAIYGTFAALPLFLIWLNISWIIILMGAKFSFAIQNHATSEHLSEKVHFKPRIQLISLLLVASACIKNFLRGLPPISLYEISENLKIPYPLTSQLLKKLVEAGLFLEIKKKSSEEMGFLPARSIETLTIKQVIDMIFDDGQDFSLPQTPESQKIIESIQKFSTEIEKSDGNLLLKDLATE